MIIPPNRPQDALGAAEHAPQELAPPSHGFDLHETIEAESPRVRLLDTYERGASLSAGCWRPTVNDRNGAIAERVGRVRVVEKCATFKPRARACARHGVLVVWSGNEGSRRLRKILPEREREDARDQTNRFAERPEFCDLPA